MSKLKSATAVQAGHSLGRRIAKHWEYYLLLLIPIVITAVFKYAPIYGVQIAFRDFNPVDGFFGSEWVGLKWFERFFSNYNSTRMITNTVLLSLYSILWTFPIPIVLSLFINQLKNKKFQRVTQTVIYAPHFISVMVLCGMLRIFLSPTGGLISTLAQFLGTPANLNFIDSSSAFRTIYISSSIWQDAGWGTIIYLATLSSVDVSLHEAAKVDGANTWQRILHIDIPVLVPIIVIQLIMSFGSLMNVGFEKAFLLQTPLNKETSEIISTYVYEQGLLKAMYSFSTAVNLFNTAVNIVLLAVVNWVCKRLSDVSFI
ncbi:sugar ABC transporter permease [Acutalibacter muris]|uniref:Sugar ABC transporter permease n=1 Tax=Acutalibacter muris TaxID=1796620 RepID=A0A1Z2XNZ7_9FIRM|nr:ABC transporter permease subunit [Acutalibacter muris]ANU53175.1 sugar ABC transporter permease [Hungateiclostridiaceae bacterium KB18]ASB40150.1 sugar ABC transporter permease [Acutalibacter muris]QQR29437.1 sugar ABC transporter permease [Acutalibacter muris]